MLIIRADGNIRIHVKLQKVQSIMQGMVSFWIAAMVFGLFDGISQYWTF